MRLLVRSATVLPLLVALALPRPASAEKLYDFAWAEDTFPGDAWNLPVGGGVGPHVLLRHAYSMPAVQFAIDYMLARGYVAHVAYDQAAGFDSPQPCSYVVLAFEKPGVTAPESNQVAAPAIVIQTTLQGGVPVTGITGGLGIYDYTAGVMQTGDDYSQFQAQDGSFDVIQLETTSSGLKPLPQPLIFGASDSPGDRKFRTFAGCTAVGAAAVLTRVAFTPPPIPQKVVAEAAIATAFVAIGCALSVWGE